MGYRHNNCPVFAKKFYHLCHSWVSFNWFFSFWFILTCFLKFSDWMSNIANFILLGLGCFSFPISYWALIWEIVKLLGNNSILWDPAVTFSQPGPQQHVVKANFAPLLRQTPSEYFTMPCELWCFLLWLGEWELFLPCVIPWRFSPVILSSCTFPSVK